MSSPDLMTVNEAREALGLPKLCECGCGQEVRTLRAHARYASAACRARAWKRRTGYGDSRRSKASRNATRRRQPRPSDARIGYLRAVDAVEALLADYEPSRILTHRERAEEALEPLLTPAGRKALS